MRLPDLRPLRGYDAVKAILGPPLRLCFPLRVEGLHHVPEAGPVVLAPNHLSIIDSIVLPLALPRRITFIAKAEHFDDWRSSWVMSLSGQIKLQRNGGMAVGRALAEAAGVLGTGGVVGIYPEGTRSRDGRLHAGNDGPAWLAMKAGAPIVPVGLVGTNAVHAPGEALPHLFRAATVRFGHPIPPPPPPCGGARTTRAALTSEVMSAIAALSGQELADDVPRRVFAV
jgi:1-acyl-sn-glycerol-3-phosphate acyltransferase